MSEQRHFHRVSFETVALITHAGHGHACDLIDLALQGALFSTSNGLPIERGDRCGLSIFLPSTDQSLEFRGELVHQEGLNYGFRFTSEDADSMMHLRRLLELNLGDSRLVDEEFDHWLKS